MSLRTAVGMEATPEAQNGRTACHNSSSDRDSQVSKIAALRAGRGSGSPLAFRQPRRPEST